MKLITSSRQFGLSIVELMVSVALGAFLSIGVVQLYVSHRMTTNSTEGVSQMQDNTRYALRTMSYHARMAGYTGCMSKDKGLEGNADADGRVLGDNIDFFNLLNKADEVSFNFRTPLEGFNDVPATMPADLADALLGDPRPNEGTDVLVVRGAVGAPSYFYAPPNAKSVEFVAEVQDIESEGCGSGIDKINDLCDCDTVVVADCERAVVVQISDLELINSDAEVRIKHDAAGVCKPGNAMASWGQAGGDGGSGRDSFGADAEIIKIETNLYYIANDDDGRPALFRKTNAEEAEVVAANVVDMQIDYGISTDTNGDVANEVNQYVSADLVTDWDEVISVRTNLLIASDNDNIVGDANTDSRMTFTFYGQDFVADDRRLYQTVTSTAVLRNAAN